MPDTGLSLMFLEGGLSEKEKKRIIRSDHCSRAVLSKMLVARKAICYHRSRWQKNRSARMLANVRRDH